MAGRCRGSGGAGRQQRVACHGRGRVVYCPKRMVTGMETKEVLLELRKTHGLSQQEMAEKCLVTRQAVSRWECGETIPNAETLKLISSQFNISINTLLGAPQQLFCQSCGMPLADDAIISHEADGSFNEKYCKWCYADGKFLTDCTMEEMIEQCVPHLGWDDKDAAREFMRKLLPGLERWKEGASRA